MIRKFERATLLVAGKVIGEVRDLTVEETKPITQPSWFARVVVTEGTGDTLATVSLERALCVNDCIYAKRTPNGVLHCSRLHIAPREDFGCSLHKSPKLVGPS